LFAGREDFCGWAKVFIDNVKNDTLRKGRDVGRRIGESSVCPRYVQIDRLHRCCLAKKAFEILQ
jgi:hypothetical protein